MKMAGDIFLFVVCIYLVIVLLGIVAESYSNYKRGDGEDS
jgi:hypothetical protein